MIAMKTTPKRTCAILLSVILALVAFPLDFQKVFADEEGKITSVLMTYNETQYDVYNNVLEVSTDYDETLPVDFEISGNPGNIALVEFYAETEDGTQTKLWSDDSGQTHAEFELRDLIPDGGIRMIVYENDNESVTKTDDIMLGVTVAEGKNHEKYTTTLPFGPQEEVDVDLSGFAPGMGIKMLPDKIPIEYKKFPDGRSVLGLGLNADDEEFWKAAKEGEIHKYSFEELANLWNKEKIYTPSATLEIRWVVLGYAVSTDDDPDSMTGVIQCYAGGTGKVSESVGYITYGVNFTMNAGTDQVFVMKPDDDPTATLPDEFQTELDLNAQTGTEIFAGVGIPFTSACVYGGATLTTECQLFPEGGIKGEYVDGKVYIKVTLMDVPVYTYTLLDGHKDLYPEKEEDGTVVYRTDMDMCAANEDALKELLANGYGNTPYKPVSPEGKQVWLGGTDLTSPDMTNGGKVGDSPCAKKIASNVYPESGIQVTKLNGDKSALVAFISNNNERASDNKGELSWMRYDNDTKTISEPLPVADDIDGDGKADTGADFAPRMRRNLYNNTVYAAWLRDRNEVAASRTLTEAAKDFRLCYAEFDESSDKWNNQTVLMDDPEKVFGGVAVGVNHPDTAATKGPSVYAYTNPADDPAGLDTASDHELFVFRRNEDSGDWEQTSLGTVTGRITAFDGGYYYFFQGAGEALAYTIEDGDGHSSVTIMNTDRDFEPIVFDGAKNGMFREAVDQFLGLVFTKDGALFTSVRNDYTEMKFPDGGTNDKALPDAPFNIIGNIGNGDALIGYLASKDGAQNIQGFIRNSGQGWYGTMMTNTDENSNVNYYDGAFFGNGEPMLIYTVKNYTEQNGEGDSGFVDGTADMYIQAGEVNTHVSLKSANVTNLDDLGADDTDASVSMLVWNNSLEPVNKVTAYIKKPDDTEYTEAGEFTFEGDNTLLPGQEQVVNFTVDGDFSEPVSYTVSAVGSSDKYDRTEIQTSTVLDIPTGRVRVTDTDYRYRDLDHDTCEITATSKGPGKKSGSLVLYNSDTKEVYKEVPFQDLMPGETVRCELTDPDGYMSDTYPKLKAKVLMDGETLDDAQPQVDDQAVRTIPSWYINPNHVKPKTEAPLHLLPDSTAADPAATDSAATDSVTADTAEEEPAATDSVTADTAEEEPAATEPTTADSAEEEPDATEPAAHDPTLLTK